MRSTVAPSVALSATCASWSPLLPGKTITPIFTPAPPAPRRHRRRLPVVSDARPAGATISRGLPEVCRRALSRRPTAVRLRQSVPSRPNDEYGGLLVAALPTAGCRTCQAHGCGHGCPQEVEDAGAPASGWG